MDFQNILIRGGHVIDPTGQFQGRQDFRIRDGILVEIASDLVVENGEHLIAAEGHWIIPSLIDLHVHAYPEKTNLGVDPDRIGYHQGVAVVADAGSVGPETFEEFYQEIISHAETKIVSWLNISKAGLCKGNTELVDLKELDPDGVVRTAKEYPRVVRGVKVRMSSSVVGTNGIKPLEVAKKAAVEARLPLMVHVGNGPPFLEEIFSYLTAGDVVTHAFHGKKGGLVDGGISLLKAYQAAAAKGVLFDVGHGQASFSFQAFEIATKAGIFPTTISTDIHLRNVEGPVYSLVKTLDKMRVLRFSLEDVIRFSTINPAQILGLDDSYGRFTIGSPARITILKEHFGSSELIDSEGEKRESSSTLEAVTMIQERKVWDLICQ